VENPKMRMENRNGVKYLSREEVALEICRVFGYD